MAFASRMASIALLGLAALGMSSRGGLAFFEMFGSGNRETVTLPFGVEVPQDVAVQMLHWYQARGTQDSFPPVPGGGALTLAGGHHRAAKTAQATDTVFSIQALRTGDGTAFGVVRAPRELWAPFRWEVRAGTLHPEGTPVGPGFFCVELDDLMTDPSTYFGICAQPVAGGLNVFVIRNGNNNVGQRFLPGTSAVDFAVEGTGTSLRFLAAAPDGGEEEVAEIAFADQQRPLFPSVGAAQMPPGTRADFDFSRVVANSLPGSASKGRVAREQVFVASDHLQEAEYALDAGAGDRDEADLRIELAVESVDEAAATVAALSDPVLVKSGGKKVAALRKAAVAAGEALAAGKPERSVLGKIRKALKSAGNAIVTLAPAVD